MTSIKGKLVARRVNTLENLIGALTPAPCYSCLPPLCDINAPNGGVNFTKKIPSRPAPSAPVQERVNGHTAVASAPGVAAGTDVFTDTAELLVSSQDSHATPSMTPASQAPFHERNYPHMGAYKYKVMGNPKIVDPARFTVCHPKRGDNVNIATQSQQQTLFNSFQETFTGHFSSLTTWFDRVWPTGRKDFKLGLLISLAFLILLVMCRSFLVTGDTELDVYFYNLNYSPDQLLVYHGEIVKTVPKGAVLSKATCIVIERTIKNKANEKSDVGVVASNEHRTFPGALLLANEHLMDNSPDLLAVDRSPLTYTVNLPGLSSDGTFTIIPSFSEYQAAVNEVLNTWFDNYMSELSLPSNFRSVESFAYSKQYLRVQFGFDFVNSVIESGIDFNAMENGEKLIKVYKFTQVFYTVSVEPTKRPSDLFDPSVTVSEVKHKTSDKNPPVLVDSVSYGRNIYVKIESRSIDKQAELNLTLLAKDHSLANAYHFNDLNIQIYVLGGNANHTELISVKNLNEVHDVINKFGKFSKKNLGYPISYSTHFIKDNKKAVIHLSTDYVESVRHNNCPKVIIKLIQKRWFCKWEVTWTETGYDGNGKKVSWRRGWDKNSQLMKLSFVSEDIEIPSHVEDLKVVAMVFTLLDSWQTVINRSNIPLIPRREFYIYADSSSETRPPI